MSKMRNLQRPGEVLLEFEKEMEYYSKLYACKSEMESRIVERKKMYHQGDPLLADSNEKKLNELAANLEEINKQLELPYSAAASAAQDKAGDISNERCPVAKQQENAILGCLRTNKHDPQKIPVPLPGKAGVKMVCWDQLCKNRGLFSSRSVFKTAWERLRANGGIKDAK